MSQTDPAPADPHQEISRAAEEEQDKQSNKPIWQVPPGEVWKAFGKLFERITPWLFEVGSWIFGGFIAFTLLIIAALIPVGPVDPATMVATAAFALALPLNVAGLFLLRLVQDLKRVGFEEAAAQAFQGVGFTVASPTALEALRQRRIGIVLSCSLGILALIAFLTLIGMMAVLWHMAWWIGVGFFAMVLLSLVIVIVAIAASQLPDSPEEREQKRRYREEMTRRAKEQYQKNEERS